MLRKDIKMRIARDMRGKITTGNRGKNDNEHPKSLHYFNLSEFPELQAIYGDKPDKILIVFPTDNIEDFYSTEYSLWGTGKGGMKIKKRSCDGETCLDCISREESPCLCADMEERECKCYMSLKAFVVNPANGVIVNFTPTLFESHSVNTADALYSELEKVWIMTGGHLRGIPFIVQVDMVEKLNTKRQKTKFPIWKLQVAGTIQNALKYARLNALPTTEQNCLAIDVTCEVEAIAAIPEKTPSEGAETPFSQEQPQNEGNGKVISEKQRKRLFAIAKENEVSNESVKAIIAAYEYESTKDIASSDYDRIIDEIRDSKPVAEPPSLEKVASEADKLKPE